MNVFVSLYVRRAFHDRPRIMLRAHLEVLCGTVPQVPNLECLPASRMKDGCHSTVHEFKDISSCEKEIYNDIYMLNGQLIAERGI